MTGLDILLGLFVLFVIMFMNWLFSWRIPGWILILVIIACLLIGAGILMGIGFKLVVG